MTKDPSPDPRMVRFVREHGGRVSAWLRRFGVSESDLDDACQEVWLVAFRHLDQLDEGAPTRGFLHTVCRRTARDGRRRAHRRYEHRPEAGDGTASARVEAAQARLLEAREQLACLAQAAADLSPNQREVWTRHTLDGESPELLAERMDCPRKTVFSRLYAAQAMLRRRLSEAGLLGVAPWRLRPGAGKLGPATAGPGSVGLAPALTVLALAGVAVMAPVMGPAVARAPGAARLVSQEQPQPAGETRRVPYLALAGARVLAPGQLRPKARVPRGGAQKSDAPEPVMTFDVLDVASPSTSLALQQVGVLEFEPVVLAADMPSARPEPMQWVTHPPDIKPALVWSGVDGGPRPPSSRRLR